jgi:hypothetical protein
VAYGYEIKNALGEDILDERKALYIQKSGTTTRPDDLGMFASNGFFKGPFSGSDIAGGAGGNPRYRCIAERSRNIVGTSTGGGPFKTPAPLWPQSAMAFYQPGTDGLCFSLEVYLGPKFEAANENPNQGLSFLSRAGQGGPRGNSLPFIVVDTAVTSTSERYGMQLLDGSGEVTFDSRAELFSISEVAFVSESIIGGILDNGGSHDIVLRKSLPNCYICIPYLTAHKWSGTDADEFRPRIRQVSNNRLRINRVNLGYVGNTNLRPRYVHDLAIFVARDPFA